MVGQGNESGLWFSRGPDARKMIAPVFRRNTTEGNPVEPDLFPWANEESRYSAFASPGEPNGSCPDRIAFVLPADHAMSAVGRREHRNFVPHTDHATIPWHKESTMSTLLHSYRHLPRRVRGGGLLGRHERDRKGPPGKDTGLAWSLSTVISNGHS